MVERLRPEITNIFQDRRNYPNLRLSEPIPRPTPRPGQALAAWLEALDRVRRLARELRESMRKR